MSRHPIEVHVSPQDRRELRSLLRAGILPVRVVLRAIALEQLAEGQTAPAVAGIVHLSPQAVRRIAHRYQRDGLERALFERQGRGAKELLDASEKQRIIAMVCSKPPEGRARWTVRLVAGEAVKRKLVPKVGRETIRVLLLHTTSSRGGEKMWWCAGINRHGAEDERASRERSSDPLGPESCTGRCEVSSEA